MAVTEEEMTVDLMEHRTGWVLGIKLKFEVEDVMDLDCCWPVSGDGRGWHQLRVCRLSRGLNVRSQGQRRWGRLSGERCYRILKMLGSKKWLSVLNVNLIGNVNSNSLTV